MFGLIFRAVTAAIAFLPGGSALGALGGIFGALGGVAAAIASVFDSVLRFIDRMGTNPLLAFIVAGLTFGSLGFGYGATWDAPLRAKAEQRAIREANARADFAIERIRKEYERKADELRKQPQRKTVSR
jgi:hypothetical protein